MESGNLYDMSFFTGVKFFLKLGVSDSAIKRMFSIPIYYTQAPPAGGCQAGKQCYAHFEASYANATAGQWLPFSYKFTDLTRESWGNAITPSTLTGSNLQQVLWLMWEEGNNGTAGKAKVDFWVDQIQFY